MYTLISIDIPLALRHLHKTSYALARPVPILVEFRGMDPDDLAAGSTVEADVSMVRRPGFGLPIMSPRIVFYGLTEAPPDVRPVPLSGILARYAAEKQDHKQVMESKTVTLPPEDWEAVKTLGNGVYSAGLRVAVQLAAHPKLAFVRRVQSWTVQNEDVDVVDLEDGRVICIGPDGQVQVFDNEAALWEALR